MNEKSPRAPRYQVGGLQIIYDTGEEFWSAPVVDVSESGIFVETHHELVPGTRVMIMPDVPHGEEALPFEIQGVVVRANEYDPDNYWDRTPGLAFRLEVTQEQFEQVRSFLAEHGVRVR